MLGALLDTKGLCEQDRVAASADLPFSGEDRHPPTHTHKSTLTKQLCVLMSALKKMRTLVG